MKKCTLRVLAFSAAFLSVLSLAGAASATTWNINFGGFGGSGSLAYSPKTMNIAVGDTVVWNGDFTHHPLAITSFPAGAATFNTVSDGSSFTYVVTVAGTYQYYCTAHVNFGMNGSFTTTDAAVPASDEALSTRLELMPNPSSKMTMIHFDVTKAGAVKISIASLDGKVIAVPLNKSLGVGGQVVNYECSSLAAGTYLVTLEADGKIITRRMVVEH